MRYPDDHKETVRAKIVEAASRALRRSGVTGVSIPSLMKKVGLTHGAFYVHFRDRDELVSEAVRFAAEGTAAQVLAVEDGSVEQMMATYLSPEHARHPENGCVLAALGSEASHQSAPIRRTFAETARGFVQLIQKRLSPARATERPTDQALQLASQMIGAVILARMVDDDALAKRILSAASQAKAV